MKNTIKSELQSHLQTIQTVIQTMEEDIEKASKIVWEFDSEVVAGKYVELYKEVLDA